ncbi:SH3 domain-containing protein Dlish isoform X1 [Stomoxys calcitrans]|uniref:SH3 domain-containing protein Dlish isoform X1 n=2 Tax=Stomoxys calcitrans TaxID=35570 RepID=UPI0027E313BB|nr:SH3 domain-containing protein Dlish isoform X1 [Stomoxys calcitrans]
MAFLCPVRMRRDKKKATSANIERDLPLPGGVTVGLGRITGSSSIETLVRVGIEKEHGLSPDSKMVVLHDFTPCVDDELEVKRGQIVNILYRENDWVYVIGEDSRQEGFIPYSYCAPYNTQLADMAIKKKLPRGDAGEHGETIPLLAPNEGNKLDLIEEVSNAQAALKNAVAELTSPLSMESECTPFHKEPNGRYIVLYTFIARDENDLSVERGEFVTLLNRDDVDWFWIVRSDGQEGFVPSAFIYPADSVLQTQQKLIENNLNKSNGQVVAAGTGASQGNLNSLSQPVTMANNGNGTMENSIQQPQNSQNSAQIPADDVRYGTELVMLYDYKAQAPDDLSVRRGDWIYADLNNQTVDGWLWSYAPKTRKYGFIPKAYARPPAMTSL